MEYKIGTPNAKQDLFLKDTHRHVGYGGARGGGKSWVLRAKALLCGSYYEGIKILIMRQTYPELEKNHIGFFRALPKEMGKLNESKKQFKFVNGSIIDFQYCQNDKDLNKLQGSEYDIIFIDEATNFTEFQLKAINACCRGTGDFPRRTYYTCNPGGQGHGYIKRIFIDKRYEDGEDPEEYSFIQALVTDNVVLMEKEPDYIKSLEALPAKLRKAWLEGSWDIFEGQFFEDFIDNPEGYQTRQWTNVIEPFDIPVGWKIYRSYDFGYRHPFSCGWWAVDYEGTYYRIAELYGCTNEPNEGVKWTPDEQFAKIREIEDTHPYLRGKNIIGVADPAIWKAESGESVEQVAARYGIYFIKGDNARIPGWMQMHYRLAFDDNGYARMYIFNTCKAFIRTIPLMMYDPTHVEDIDTDLEDHVADESRYFCMMNPINPVVRSVSLPLTDDPLNQRVTKRRSMFT